MASEVEIESLVVRLLADASDLIKNFDSVADKTKEVAELAEKNAKRIEGFAGAVKDFAAQAATALGALAIADFLKGAKEEWQQSELASSRLSAVLASQGREVQALMADYNEFASELQKTTVYSDEQVLALLKAAETFGLTGQAAKKATQDAIALAAITDGDAKGLMRMTAAMEKGDVQLAMHMARMVPQLRGIGDEAELQAKYLELVAAGQQQVAAEAETGWGRAQRAANAMSDALEDVGRIYSQIANPLKMLKKEAIEWFTSLSDGGKTAVVTSAATAAALLAIGPTVALLTPAVGLLASSFTLLKTGTLAVGAALSALANPTGLLISLWSAWNATVAAGQAIMASYGWAVWGAGLAAFAAGLVYLTYKLVMATQAGKTFQEEMDKIKSLGASAAGQFQAATQQRQQRAEAIPDQAGRVDFLKKEVEKSKQLVAIYEEQLATFQKRQADFQEAQGFGGAGGPIGRLIDPRQQVLSASVESARRQLDEVKKSAAAAGGELEKALNPAKNPQLVRDIEELTAKFEKQILTYGMSENQVALYDLRIKGATQAMLEQADQAMLVKEALDTQAKEYEKAAEAVKKLADDSREMALSLEADVATFGMASEAARLFKLEQEGLDEATAGHIRGLIEQKKELEDSKKIMEEGQRVREQVLGKDPAGKYQLEMEKLNELLQAGAIDQNIYSMAVAQAEKEMDKAGKTASGMKDKIDAATSGSAEALSRIAAFQDQISGTKASVKSTEVRKFEAVPRAGAEANQKQEKQINLLADIKVAINRMADRETVELAALNLA